MQHFHSIEEVELRKAWATVGAFDGVHRGHQAILAPLAVEAHAAGLPAVVVTFHPLPVVVLRGIEEPHYLTSPEERAELLGELGIDVVVTMPFNREIAGWSAEKFMQTLVKQLGLQQLWVGDDFALGRNRQGDIPTLRAMGQEMGYDVRVIPRIDLGESSLSSSQARSLLREGQVEQAAQLLGRLYSLEGEVVHGDARGRGLGFPTANLAVWSEKVLPAKGVYATWAWLSQAGADGSPTYSQRVPAVTNIGLRPTFPGQPATPRIEAHLLDYSADLYGQLMKLEFVEYLRPEQRFPSVDELRAQIQHDSNQAREVLAHAA